MGADRTRLGLVSLGFLGFFSFVSYSLLQSADTKKRQMVVLWQHVNLKGKLKISASPVTGALEQLSGRSIGSETSFIAEEIS